MLFTITLAGCSFGINSGEQNPTHGTLVGTIQDGEYPDITIQAAEIQIGDQVIQVTDGTYEVKNLANGIYTMKLTKQWYKPLELKVQVQGSTTKDIVITPNIAWNELDLFARLVRAEAEDQPYLGQVAVASTVLNRVLDPRYPNTLTGVINHITYNNGIAYYQYEPIKNGTINNPANGLAKSAVRDALNGWDPTRGASGFFAHDKVPKYRNGQLHWVWEQWENDPFKIRIDDHSFFR